MDSRATASWEGDLMSGKGRISAQSGTFKDANLSWKARTEGAASHTSPEELLAAAHAACFSMALSNGLGQAGHKSEELEVSAEVTFVPGEGITGIVLTVRGRVPGMDAAGFREAAESAKAGCPVSKALAGTTSTLGSAELAG